MQEAKINFYSLSIMPKIPLDASCVLHPYSLYFSTERKLEIWKRKNPDVQAEFGMHEISVKCAKELIKLARKKPKHKCRCGECGK